MEKAVGTQPQDRRNWWVCEYITARENQEKDVQKNSKHQERCEFCWINLVVRPLVMDEEMGVFNEVESRGISGPDTLESDNPSKSPALNVRTLRNLAIASIICGCSCIGVLALIYAVKTITALLQHLQKGNVLVEIRWLESPHLFTRWKQMKSLGGIDFKDTDWIECKSLEANEKQKAHCQNAALHWARKSRFMSCLSIIVWVSLLILIPMLLVLMSYLISKAE